MKNVCSLVVSFCLLAFCALGQDPFAKISSTPSVIQLVPDGVPYRDMTINKDWNEAFFTIQGHNRTFSAIVYIQKKNGKWSKPKVADFSGKYNDLEPAFSPDGKRIYFSSNRPTPDNKDKKDMDIWYVERTSTGWSEPVNVGAPVNTSGNEFFPSIAANGSIYFTASYERAKGADIYYSFFSEGKYSPPVALGAAINEATFEINPFISPDESFLIYSAYNRPNSLGGADLFISFKDANDNWQPSVRMDAPVNSSAIDYCPFVSADGKYFFFTSARSAIDQSKAYDYEGLLEIIKGDANGLEHVYAVEFSSVARKRQ